MRHPALNPRRVTRPVRVGRYVIGGDAPIAVQSMTKTDTRDVDATLDQIEAMEKAGCEIVRMAVPDAEAAAAVAEIRRRTPATLVADIHFQYRLALTVLGRDFAFSGDGPWPTLYGVQMRGNGIFVHTDLTDRPTEIYGGTTTLLAGGRQQSYLLLPVVPAAPEVEVEVSTHGREPD